MKDPLWTEEEFMKTLKYHKISDDGIYAKYGNDFGLVCPSYGTMPKDKRTIYFNRAYDPDQGIFVGLKEDWDTRSVFNGVVDNEILLKLIIDAVR